MGEKIETRGTMNGDRAEVRQFMYIFKNYLSHKNASTT